MASYKIIMAFFILMIAPLNVFADEDNQSLPINKMTQTVVYLEGAKPKVEMIKGLPHEIGFRRPGSKEFQLLTDRVTGTGFFVRDANRLFLATAGHVAKDLLANVKLISSDISGNSKSYPLDGLVKWVFSDEADVAVSLINDEILRSVFLDNALELNLLPTTKTAPISELSLMVVGFPLGLGVQQKFSPLRRETHAASGLIDLKRADIDQISTFIVLQDPSIGGYSGAPVFAIKTYLFGDTVMKGIDIDLCVGIIHGTISDSTGGKLGLITPGKYVFELIKNVHNNL